MLRKWWYRSLKILPYLALIGAFLIAFDFAENSVARGFGECISDISSQQATEGAKQNGVIIGNLIHPQIICSLRLVDRHNGFFALLGTIAVACFTLTLWQSTDRLWQLGERTAERQLRAYVLIESAAFVLDENTRGMFTGDVHVKIKNFGVTPAIVVLRSESEIAPERNLLNIRFSSNAITHPKATIAPGAFWSLRIPVAPPIGPNDRFLLQRGWMAAYIWGSIEYETLGTKKFTNFQMMNRFDDVTMFGFCENGNESD